jgi:hypothetical protein
MDVIGDQELLKHMKISFRQHGTISQFLEEEKKPQQNRANQ